MKGKIDYLILFLMQLNFYFLKMDKINPYQVAIRSTEKPPLKLCRGPNSCKMEVYELWASYLNSSHLAIWNLKWIRIYDRLVGTDSVHQQRELNVILPDYGNSYLLDTFENFYQKKRCIQYNLNTHNEKVIGSPHISSPKLFSKTTSFK